MAKKKTIMESGEQFVMGTTPAKGARKSKGVKKKTSKNTKAKKTTAKKTKAKKTKKKKR